MTPPIWTVYNRKYIMQSLTFRALRDVNLKRSKEIFLTCAEWNPRDWACSVAGEVGEACNLIQKRHRGDDIQIKDIGKYMADIVTFVDLLAASLNIDLEQAVIKKFNEVSKRRNSIIFLPE